MSQLTVLQPGECSSKMRNRAIASSAESVPPGDWRTAIRLRRRRCAVPPFVRRGRWVRARALVVRADPVDLPACAPGRSPVRARGWHWHRQLHWIPGTMSTISTTTMRTLACALPVTLG